MAPIGDDSSTLVHYSFLSDGVFTNAAHEFEFRESFDGRIYLAKSINGSSALGSFREVVMHLLLL